MYTFIRYRKHYKTYTDLSCIPTPDINTFCNIFCIFISDAKLSADFNCVAPALEVSLKKWFLIALNYSLIFKVISWDKIFYWEWNFNLISHYFVWKFNVWYKKIWVKIKSLQKVFYVFLFNCVFLSQQIKY